MLCWMDSQRRVCPCPVSSSHNQHIRWCGHQASLRLAVSSKLLRFNSQDLSMTVYAYAKLVQCGATPPPPPTLINALAVEAAAKAREDALSPQQLSNVLWALATLKHQSPAMQMPTFAQAAARSLPDSNAQNVSNMLWAFATLGYVLPPLVRDAFDATLGQRLPDFSSQALANTAWAMAKAPQRPPPHLLQVRLIGVTDWMHCSAVMAHGERTSQP
jgi:hypothetical protein